MKRPILYQCAVFLTGRRAKIVGPSMAPALIPHDRVLFDRLAYRVVEPTLGDIVLAEQPGIPNTRVVKRIAAIPGDHIVVRNSVLLVNGTPYETGSDHGSGEVTREHTLAPKEYLLVGDAQDQSSDGRHHGPIHKKNILGRAWRIYAPVSRACELAALPKATF